MASAVGGISNIGPFPGGGSGVASGVASFNARTGTVTLTLADVQAIVTALPATPSVGLWLNGNVVSNGTIG